MTVKTKFVGLMLAFSGTVCAAGQNAEKNSPMGEFIQACSAFIQPGQTEVLLETQCLSNAVSFCKIATGEIEGDACTLSQIEWLEETVSQNWKKLPTDMRRGWPEPPTSAELTEKANTFFSGVNVPPLPELNCADARQELLCRYSDALSGWLALRILERSVLQRVPSREGD